MLVKNKEEKTVLILEDDALNGRLIKSILDKTGFVTKLFGEGALALDEIAKNCEIQIVLLDIIMPNMDGFEFVKKMRLIRKSLPFIVVTSVKDSTSIQKMNELGAVDFIYKPFKSSDLVSRVALSCIDLLPNKKAFGAN